MYITLFKKKCVVLVISLYFGAVELHVLGSALLLYIVVYAPLIQNAANLALHKKAYETNSGYSSSPGLAVDGGLSQNFGHGSCTHTANHANMYWEVDLGNKFFIDHVTIYNRGDCCGARLRDVELHIGLDIKSYKLYGFHEGAVGSVYTFELKNVVFGQWIRITRIPSVIDYLTLCEVQVFGYPHSQGSYFRNSINQVGTDIQSSMRRASIQHCAYTCLKTNACEAANYDEDTQMCDLMASISIEEDTNGSVLLPD